MKKIITLCSILLATTQAYAQYTTNTGTLKYLSVYPTSAIVQVSVSTGNAGGCTFAASDQYYSLPMDGSQASNIQYAAMLSAYVSGENIRFQVEGCDGIFPKVLSVELPK